RLLLTSQLDYVRYGEIQTPFASLAPGGLPRFAVFAWEPRVGIELSLPFSSMSIQLRAGLSGRSTTGAEGGSPAAAAPVPTVPPSPSPDPGPPATALQQITAVLPETPRGKETGLLRGSVGGSL